MKFPGYPQKRTVRLKKRDRFAVRNESGPVFKKCGTRLVVQIGPEDDASHSLSIQRTAEGLGDGSSLAPDLRNVQIRHAVLFQQGSMLPLQAPAKANIIDIHQLAAEDLDPGRRQDELTTPLGCDMAGRKLRCITEEATEFAECRRVDTMGGQNLAERGDLKTGAVERAEAPLDIVESMLPAAILPGNEVQRKACVTHPPDPRRVLQTMALPTNSRAAGRMPLSSSGVSP